jgi:Flp pilus assembly protein TadD
MKRVGDAVGALNRAATLEPSNARFAYAYAIALQSTGKLTQAVQVLERARTAHPNDTDIVTALSGMRR